MTYLNHEENHRNYSRYPVYSEVVLGAGLLPIPRSVKEKG